jgi:peptidoglycan/LPS O-acetylase OafA/YrhL
MGTVRFLLAFAVVFAHSYGFVFTGGQLAVQIFYVISGYLISLILLSNSSYKNLRYFYLNRWLRLFPVYYFVAILSLAAFIFSFVIDNDLFFYVFKEVGWVGALHLVLSNIFILGQDLIFLTGIFDGNYSFTTDFTQSELPIWTGLLVPQAWTLALEITFYLIAPFILKDKRIWIVLMFVSIALRIYLINIGIGNNSFFSHRFFPTELALFLLGAFSHQIIKPIYEKFDILNNKFLMNLFTCISVLFVINFFLIPINRVFLALSLIFFIVLTLPFLASFQRNYQFDNFLGSLSYPIYICHILVISVLNFFIDSKISDPWLYYSILILCTLCFSYFLEIFINQKVDTLRDKYRKVRV